MKVYGKEVSPVRFWAVVITALILIFVETAIGVWLWNLLMPAIFGITKLTCWQFFGLSWLLSILLPSKTSLFESCLTEDD